MDEDETHPVAGVSGSCMLIRREVVNQIGFMDEHFFAYQEDADYCFQTRKAGWDVFYFPQAQITHFGGLGGSRVQPFQSIYQWHRSYFLYFRKNLAKDYFFLFNWIYYLAMFLKLILALISNALRREKIPGTRRP
jgi:GT2 family glycosyltransferase